MEIITFLLTVIAVSCSAVAVLVSWRNSRIDLAAFAEDQRQREREELRRVAFHGAGHAVISLTQDPRSVQLVWIRREPRKIEATDRKPAQEVADTQGALLLWSAPNRRTREDLVWYVAGYFAGKVAEIELGSPSTRSGTITDDYQRAEAAVEKFAHENGLEPSEAEQILVEGSRLARDILWKRRCRLFNAILEELLEKRVLTSDELLSLNERFP